MERQKNFTAKDIKETYESMKAVTQRNDLNYSDGRVRQKRSYVDTDSIQKIIENGTADEIVSLSRYYFNTNGLYRRIVLYFATMLLYDTIVIPKFTDVAPAKERMLKNFNKTLAFVDKMNIRQEFSRIMTVMLIEGVYYGLIYDTPDGSIIFGDLPRSHCRTRFRSNNGNQILEFNVNYFDTIVEERERKLILSNFPEFIIQYYNRYKAGREPTCWCLCPEELGVAFTCSLDGNASTKTIPFFVQTIPAISRLKDYQKADQDSIENELNKLVINQIPLDDENELAFDLTEVKEVHNGIANMLKDNDHIDVITTFCDTKVESLSSDVENVRNDLSTITHLVYNEAGISKQLFDNDSAISITYSVQNDLALVVTLVRPLQHWLTYEINQKFCKIGDFFYEVEILPISHYNRGEISKLYLQGAQYGYSKFLAGVSLGIKQSDLISLTAIENDMLNLDEKMIPLQSSHTTSDKAKTTTTSDDSSSESSGTTESNGEPGAPEKETKDKSPKTIKNKESE